MVKKDEKIKRWDVLLKKLKHKKNIIGVEIGVWKGYCSRKLLKKNKELFLYLVDKWESPNKNSSFYKSGSRIAKKKQDKFDKSYNEVVRKLEQYKERYKIIKKDSVEASKEFEDESVDFIFIDADHSYEGVKRDILAWYPKVKKGGIISGHDYKNKNYNFDGVELAVDEFFGRENIEINEDSTWVYYK